MHWRRFAKLKRAQRLEVFAALNGRTLPKPPLVVVLTRIAPRKLDDDNLASAFKYIRDQIAEMVGVDDGSPVYTWVYLQRTGEYGIDIEMVEGKDRG